MPIYTHFFTPCINQETMYIISKVPPYHKKSDKHNLTKKSDFFPPDFD